MDFTPDPDHEEIRAGIRRLCAKFDDDYWRERDETKTYPVEFHRAIAEGGWLGINVPTEYGGAGLGVTEAAIVEQEIAASGAGMNGCSAVHNGIFGLEPIIKHGSEELKSWALPLLIKPDVHLSFAITEPDAGTDTTRITTTARKVDGGYLVSGKKVWISKAQIADYMLLLCRTSPRDEGRRPTDGMTLFLAPLDRTKVTVRAIPKMGRNAVDSNELFIDELFIPEENVVGDVGNGFRVLLSGLNAERVISANAAIGIGRAALRRATEYAKTRVVFGRPIGANQGVSFPLAEALIRLDAADLMCRQAAWMIDNGLKCGREANAAKYLASEAGFAAADVAMTVHGGYGYSKEYHIERYFREARLLKIAPISQNLVLGFIAEHVLGLPRGY
jgi:Acyl-CoA dehydrogenases